MVVVGSICLIIVAIFLILWLYRKIFIAKRYTKTVGEIIDFKNMAPLVNKRAVFFSGNYAYTECNYQGDVYVTVRFISKEGEELTRRYNSSKPLRLKINEHKHSVTQYKAIFPEWQMGKKIKVFYNPTDTLDIFVGKAPPINKIKKQ